MPLSIELQSLFAHVSVEVDRELGDAQQGAVVTDESQRPIGAGADGDPTGDPQVSVEPGVEERPAVHLDAELLPPR